MYAVGGGAKRIRHGKPLYSRASGGKPLIGVLPRPAGAREGVGVLPLLFWWRERGRKRDREREREVAILAQVNLPLLRGRSGTALRGCWLFPVLLQGGRSLERGGGA